MRVTIDATSLILPGAGIKNYMYYWLRSLQEALREPDDIICTYPPTARIPSVLDHQQASQGYGVRMVQICNIRHNPLLRLLLSRADVFHASQHLANMPRRKN